MKNTNPAAKHREEGSAKIVLIIMLFLLFVLPFQLLSGQDVMEAKLKMAVDAYKSAHFDKAIELLTAVSNDPSLDKSDKKEVLRFLGLSYTAKGLYDKAKQAMTELLELEPPLIELDPDREPPKLMKIYYETRKSLTGNYQVERPDPGIKTIAILDFKNRSVDDKQKFDPMQQGFADLLINQMSGAVDLKVIERERINWIMNEIGLENDPGKFDTESAVRVGKQLGVHTVLLGSFIKFKNQLWLGARLVKVETSEILLTDEIKGKADDFFDLSEKLAQKITKDINVDLPKAQIEKDTETHSLDALMSYSEGLSLLEKGNYKEAYDKFQNALKLDPNYKKAELKAESIKPLIG